MQSHTPSGIQCDQGLTLIELMVVLVLALLLMATTFLVYQIQHKTGQEQNQVSMMQQDIRAAMEMITRDIQMAGCDPSMGQIGGILEEGSNAITLEMDITGAGGEPDGDANDSGENVRYSLSANTIIRSDNQPAPGNNSIIAYNIDNLSFIYNTDGAGDIDSVSVTIQAEVDNNGTTLTRRLTRSVSRRNL